MQKNTKQKFINIVSSWIRERRKKRAKKKWFFFGRLSVFHLLTFETANCVDFRIQWHYITGPLVGWWIHILWPFLLSAFLSYWRWRRRLHRSVCLTDIVHVCVWEHTRVVKFLSGNLKTKKSSLEFLKCAHDFDFNIIILLCCCCWRCCRRRCRSLYVHFLKLHISCDHSHCELSTLIIIVGVVVAAQSVYISHELFDCLLKYWRSTYFVLHHE